MHHITLRYSEMLVLFIPLLIKQLMELNYEAIPNAPLIKITYLLIKGSNGMPLSLKEYNNVQLDLFSLNIVRYTIKCKPK